MPFFMLVPVLVLSLGAFVTAKIRVLFIMIVLITLPMWFVLQNIPYIKRHARSMIDSMIGATLAPFLSATTLFVGWTYVSNTAIPSLEEWISVLGIVTLAGAWPILLAPMLSHIVTPVQRSIETAVMSSSMMSMQMGMGAVGGAISGVQADGGIATKAASVLGGTAGGMVTAGVGSMPEAQKLGNVGMQTSGLGGDKRGGGKSGGAEDTQDPSDSSGKSYGWLPPGRGTGIG